MSSITSSTPRMSHRLAKVAALMIVPTGLIVGAQAPAPQSIGSTSRVAWAQPVVAFDLDCSVGQDARRARDVDVV